MIGIAANTKAERRGLVTTIMAPAPTNSTRLRSATDTEAPTAALICSHFVGWLQFLDHRFDALGKAFRIEIQRIVVAVGNIGVERGVVGRNEPVPRAHAGNHVEERESVVLRRRESRIGALRIVMAALAGGGAPRLN